MAYVPDRDDDDDINEWQQVQHPFLEESPSTVHQSRVASNNFVIEDNYLLHDRRSATITPANPEDDQSSSQPSSPASASSSCVSDEDVIPIPSPTQSEWRLRVASEGWKLLKVRFEAIRDGVVRAASKVRDYAICLGAFWSITCITGVALATAALLVYAGIQRGRRRRRRTLPQQRMDHMACLVRERDEGRRMMGQVFVCREYTSSCFRLPI
ncbi:uncharacterized protein LOC129311210 isoform X2 [Prosopis cineraria]|uniref:uncharacterized protein LOC129311210 isoform X2 n=1 Tax=Prosopis cineraria TaxID=364024 RepID=UPI00240F8306|nr:uncharacterized protein LOC129311210 isoform X2 [Prosopis cineraria]